MSDLYRSALGARLAKLPPDIPISDEAEYDEEENDSLGALPVPGSGLGPPAMCVPISTSSIYIHESHYYSRRLGLARSNHLRALE